MVCLVIQLPCRPESVRWKLSSRSDIASFLFFFSLNHEYLSISVKVMPTWFVLKCQNGKWLAEKLVILVPKLHCVKLACAPWPQEVLTLFLGEGVVLTENGMITLHPTCDAEGRSRRYDRICFSTIIHIGHLLLWLSLALFMTLGIKPAFVSRMAGLPTDSTSLFVILFFIILGWFSFSFAVLVFSSFALIILSFSIPLFTFPPLPQLCQCPWHLGPYERCYPHTWHLASKLLCLQIRHHNITYMQVGLKGCKMHGKKLLQGWRGFSDDNSTFVFITDCFWRSSAFEVLLKFIFLWRSLWRSL